MEEKERYKLESYNEAFCQIHDTESDEWYLRKDLVKDLLNQQDKHIKELEEKIRIQEQKVRKEVVEEIRERLKKANFEIMSPIDLYSYTDNFLYQVEKEVKGR